MTPTGRWSRSEPEMQQIRLHPRPAGRLPDLDFSAIEARIVVGQFRDRFPEIAKMWADVSAAKRKGRK